jgi:hypothetical protein|tara:strand:- start:13312 stop:13986 length:675 start_codon:yes stop_codon:yes gene_type:complete
MSHVTQTYFQKNDSINSTTYNDNLDSWETASKTISSNNVRDQGLDMHSFKAQSSIDDFASSNVAAHPALGFTVSDLGTTKTLPSLTLPKVIFNQNNETYIYRCSFDWRYNGIGTAGATTPSDTFYQIMVFFTVKSDEMSGMSSISGTRKFKIPNRINYATHITGDLTFAAHITRDRLNFNSDEFTNLKITPNIQVSKGSSSLPNNPELYITGYTANLTKFIGGE